MLTIIWSFVALGTLTLLHGVDAACTAKSLGCWRENANRAISGGIRFNSNNPVEDCKNYAARNGWKVYAVQYRTECFTSPNAHTEYTRYGQATNCASGRGGYMANSVYEVVCAPDCKDKNGKDYFEGQHYIDDNNARCTCGPDGNFACLCEGGHVSCPAGHQKWTDQTTCQPRCIPSTGMCYSSGDPHYRSFDGKYFNFHGACTYQAASCDDFTIFLKNFDLLGRAPRYTGRAEVQFYGSTYSISNNYVAEVNGEQVQLPYVKTFTNGDIIKIQNNGQLEIVVYQMRKGRLPAARVRATHAGRYINAAISLHGSCAVLTEGLCGNFNGNPSDDLVGGSPNSAGIHYQEYDENCPAPPDPVHPCDRVDDGYRVAAEICDAFKGSPFSSCHSTVPYGNDKEGPYSDCMEDVCNCFLEANCACSVFDTYATNCVQNGVDISDWRREVEYCPYDCPEGRVYMSAGPVPAPTCLERNPEQEGTDRGCFCPKGQFLQDGQCVDASQCKCLFEGKFYNVGDDIDKRGECKRCTCQEHGTMSCTDLPCPALSCAADQIKAVKADDCCPFCASDWVKAVNPEITVTEGQMIALTCEIDAEGVLKKDIKWFKGEEEFLTGISDDKKVLKVKSAALDDSGEWRCQATLGDKKSDATFKVTVKEEEKNEIVVTPKEPIVKCKMAKKCLMFFTVENSSGQKLKKSQVKVCKLIEGKPAQCKGKRVNKKGTIKYKLGKRNRRGGDYVAVITLNGKEYVSDATTLMIATA